MNKKIVVFGGGTGLSNLLKGMKEIEGELTVVVTIADDGGSTGKIRDYYDIPAPGDLRRVVLALSDNENMEELMNYRFDDKLEKHTIGNLMLAALTDIKGDMTSAVKEYCNILDVKQTVLPLSNKSLRLMAKMKSGKLVYGESRIAEHEEAIAEICYQGDCEVNEEVLKKIDEAEYIVFSCGSLFTSLIANLTIPEVSQRINKSKAKVIYVANLVTQKGETDNYTLANHVNVINNHLHNERVDYVFANNNYNVAQEILDNYDTQNSRLIYSEKISDRCSVIEDDFLLISNGHIRHNAKHLREVLAKVMEE